MQRVWILVLCVCEIPVLWALHFPLQIAPRPLPAIVPGFDRDEWKEAGDWKKFDQGKFPSGLTALNNRVSSIAMPMLGVGLVAIISGIFDANHGNKWFDLRALIGESQIKEWNLDFVLALILLFVIKTWGWFGRWHIEANRKAHGAPLAAATNISPAGFI